MVVPVAVLYGPLSIETCTLATATLSEALPETVRELLFRVAPEVGVVIVIVGATVSVGTEANVVELGSIVTVIGAADALPSAFVTVMVVVPTVDAGTAPLYEPSEAVTA